MKPAEVHHGEMISIYLTGKRPLPKWAEYRIFPRSGSTAPYHCVFVPGEPRRPACSSADWYWAKAVNGQVYCFRKLDDAETFLGKSDA